MLRVSVAASRAFNSRSAWVATSKILPERLTAPKEFHTSVLPLLGAQPPVLPATTGKAGSVTKRDASTTTTAKATKKGTIKKNSTSKSTKKAAPKKKKAAPKEKKAVTARSLKPSSRPPTIQYNPYSVFIADFFKAEKDRHQDGKINFTDTTKRASEAFKALSAEERAKLQDAAKLKREQALQEYDDWLDSLSFQDIQAENKYRRKFASERKASQKPRRHKKLLRHPDEPKRPLTAFLRFSMDVRANPSLKDEIIGDAPTVAEAGKRIGVAWRNLSESEKRPYVDATEVAIEQYKEDMVEFKATH